MSVPTHRANHAGHDAAGRPLADAPRAETFSVRKRILLLQAAAFVIALLFLASGLLLNQQIVRNIELPMERMNEILQNQDQILAAQHRFLDAASLAYMHPGQGRPRDLLGIVAALPHAEDSLSRLPVSAAQRKTLAEIRRLQDHLGDQVRAAQDVVPGSPRAVAAYDRVREMSKEIFARVDERKQFDLSRLRETAERLPALTRAFYALLAGFTLYVTFVLWGFRRFDQRHLWIPVETLQRMTEEIRQGNLDIRAESPSSIEFGKLVGGFLAMAAELSRMRGALEQKVHDRTVELAETQRELVQAAKLSSLGQLVSGVAHEINNPLTSILGFAELQLARRMEDPATRRSLEMIREQALRLKLLVSNLNAFAQTRPAKTRRMDLRAVLDQVVEFNRFHLTSLGIRLHEDRPQRPLWVKADREQLAQVVFNLVLNAQQAVAAADGAGDIWVSCGAEYGRAWMSVRDNGNGMPNEVAQRAFDPFFTTRPAGKGSGLGLSIARSIVQRYGGTIELESTVGRGTRARFFLPLAGTPESVGGPPAPQEKAAAPAGEVRVLVVDDEEAVTEMISAWLDRRGYAFTVLHNPYQFETLLDLRKFDLLLCDLQMPGRSGLQLLESLRESRPNMAQRFLLMTGNLSELGSEEDSRLAGVPVLRKPFTLARLADAVDALLSLHPAPDL